MMDGRGKRFGSYTPCFLNTSATIGTVLLTGLAMMHSIAFGQCLAAASARFLTIVALVLNKSSLVMPGLRLEISVRGKVSLNGAYL